MITTEFILGNYYRSLWLCYYFFMQLLYFWRDNGSCLRWIKMPAFLWLLLTASVLFHTPSTQQGIIYDGNSIYVLHGSVCAALVISDVT